MKKKISNIPQKTDWHVHTDFTDGANSVFEMCEQAVKNNIKSLAFTEHSRKKINYDFKLFYKQVMEAKRIYKYEMDVLIGCEAKVIDENGNLDLCLDIIEKVDLIIGVFHGFHGDYYSALINMLKNPLVSIWGHPFWYLIKNKIPFFNNKKLMEILKICKENNVIFEINQKYPICNYIMEIVKNYKLKTVRSSDAHSIEELLLYSQD